MDHRNLIPAIILSVAIIVGWDFFYEAPKREALRQQRAIESAQQSQAVQSAQSGTELSVTRGDIQANLQEETAVQKIKSPRITIDTSSLSGSIALRGARIDDIVLKKFQESLDPDSPQIILLRSTDGETPYYASFGWVGSAELELPDTDTLWEANQKTLTENSPVTLSWTNSQGVIFEQNFSIDTDYLITVTQNVRNNSDNSWVVRPYGLISRSGTPDTLGFYILHEGPIGVQNGDLNEIDYSDLRKDKNIDFGETQGGWLGITDKYWLVALLPDSNALVRTGFKAGQSRTEEGKDIPLYQADTLAQTQTLAPRQNVVFENHLFVGAKTVTLLDEYEERFGIEGFDLAVDFGWFYFITKPIFYLVIWFFELLGNFGLAIIAMTIMIRLIFFPLAHKSFTSMARMKKLQPEIMTLREAHKGDQRRISAEMMKLYRHHKVNPLSGCFPILLQIPVFFALYKVLFITIEMRHAPFFGWIKDLSAPDPLGLLTAFGLISWNVPAFISFLNVGIWPIAMGLTMWLQQKLNPSPPDPIQQKIFALMPLVFTFLLGTFPAGLVIYWTWSNILSIAQQAFIFHRLNPDRKKKA